MHKNFRFPTFLGLRGGYKNAEISENKATDSHLIPFYFNTNIHFVQCNINIRKRKSQVFHTRAADKDEQE